VIRLNAQLEAEAGVFTLTGPSARSGPEAGFATDDDIALALSTSGTTSTPGSCS